MYISPPSPLPFLLLRIKAGCRSLRWPEASADLQQREHRVRAVAASRFSLFLLYLSVLACIEQSDAYSSAPTLKTAHTYIYTSNELRQHAQPPPFLSMVIASYGQHSTLSAVLWLLLMPQQLLLVTNLAFWLWSVVCKWSQSMYVCVRRAGFQPCASVICLVTFLFLFCIRALVLRASARERKKRKRKKPRRACFVLTEFYPFSSSATITESVRKSRPANPSWLRLSINAQGTESQLGCP